VKRRSFLQSIIGVATVVSAGFFHICTRRCEDDTRSIDYDPWDHGVQFTEKLCELDLESPPTHTTTLEHKKDINENRFYNPQWNVNGNWDRAESRSALLSHLNGPNHNFSLQKLNNMSTDELQKLHDEDHNLKKSRTWKWWRK
jgi:hypothetical protein